MDKINAHRDEIDVIEKDLIKLLNRRAELAIHIGHRKREHQLPIYDPAREESILNRVENNNPGPLSGSAIRKIFMSIIEETRSLEDEKNK